MSANVNSLLRNREELEDVLVKGVEHLWYLVLARATRILASKLTDRELVCDALTQFEYRLVKYFHRIVDAPDSAMDLLELVNSRLYLALKSSCVEAVRQSQNAAAVSSVMEDGADWSAQVADPNAVREFEDCLGRDVDEVRHAREVLDEVGVALWQALSHPHRRVLQATWATPRKAKEKTHSYTLRLAEVLAADAAREGQRPMSAGRIEVYLSEIRSALKRGLMEAGADEELLAAHWSEVGEELLSALKSRPAMAQVLHDPTLAKRGRIPSLTADAYVA